MKKYYFLCFFMFVFSFVYAQAKIDENATEDLQVRSLELISSPAVVGKECQIKAKIEIKATSTEEINKIINSKFEDFGDFVIESATTTIATITGASSSSVFIDLIYKGHFKSVGTKALVFTIDKADTIDETNESNNSKTESITVSASPVVKGDPAFKMSGMINGLNNAKIMISWNTNQAAMSELFYRPVGQANYQSVKSTVNKTTHRMETSVLPVGDYEYFVKSVNAQGVIATSQHFIAKASSFSAPVDITGGQTLTIIPAKATPIAIKDAKLYNSLKGKIIMRVQKKGEAYYVNPLKQEMYSLGRPDDAFAIMRQKGIGISNANLDKLFISLKIKSSGPDQDLDGLSDIMEDAIGTNKTKKDTDGDTFTDKGEVEGGFNPTKGGGAKMSLDANFANSQSGKIFLATEKHGEAWYINPSDKKRYFLGRPADAFAVMRGLGVGISEGNFGKL